MKQIFKLLWLLIYKKFYKLIIFYILCVNGGDSDWVCDTCVWYNIFTKSIIIYITCVCKSFYINLKKGTGPISI